MLATESFVGPRQIILGLVVDMNKMTIVITDAHLQQECKLLNSLTAKSVLAGEKLVATYSIST
jgi:hypothetical protein